MRVLPADVQRIQKKHQLPWNWNYIQKVESPRRCWEVIPGLLEGYPEVFCAEPSLQPYFGNANPCNHQRLHINVAVHLRICG